VTKEAALAARKVLVVVERLSKNLILDTLFIKFALSIPTFSKFIY
jgi:hypothetical protein